MLQSISQSASPVSCRTSSGDFGAPRANDSHLVNSYDPVQIIYEPKETDEHGIRIEGPKNNTRVLRPAAGPRTRRSVAAAKLRFEQKWGDILIIDDAPAHTAHSLCQSPNSAGPSFLNEEEGYYCDMHSKTLHPVCKKEKEQDKVCFDTEQIELGKLSKFDVYYAST